MPQFEIPCAPERLRVSLDYEGREAIKETFRCLLCPLVPKGEFIGVKFYNRTHSDFLDVVYYGTFALPADTRQLTREAALLTDVAIYDWDDDRFMMSVHHRSLTAHEKIEHAAQLLKIRSQGHPQDSFLGS